MARLQFASFICCCAALALDLDLTHSQLVAPASFSHAALATDAGSSLISIIFCSYEYRDRAHTLLFIPAAARAYLRARLNIGA